MFLIKYNMKVLTIKKRTLCVILVCIILICSVVGICYAVQATSSPKLEYTIVIDAGHGGRDGGSVGELGSIEKELNLEYANSLKSMLEKSDVKVVMTRKDDNGLYEEDASNKKLSDMRARRDIIRSAKPDLVISIHMNSYPLKNCVGAKTFYKINSEASLKAAQCVQDSLHYYINNASSSVSEGDYYILNCTDYTSILIECGFISNPMEEQLLADKHYREDFIYSVYCGILMYLGI